MERLDSEQHVTENGRKFQKKEFKESRLKKVLNKRVLFLVKIIITLIILFFIFRRVELAEVYEAARGIRVSIFLLILVLTAIKIIIQYKNWGTCLRITTDYRPAKNEILRSHFIGYALRFLIPGGHGTFAKVYFVTNRKKATLFSVGIEKFMQTWTNIWFASWAGFFYFQQFSIYLRISAVIIITLMPLIVYRSSRILQRPHWKEYFNLFIKVVPVITIRQILFVFLTVVQYYLIINQFHPVSLIRVMLSVPLILLANSIPITYAGLGLRETFAIHILREYNIQPEIAITASLVIFVLNSVLPALAGAVLLLAVRKSKEMKEKEQKPV